MAIVNGRRVSRQALVGDPFLGLGALIAGVRKLGGGLVRKLRGGRAVMGGAVLPGAGLVNFGGVLGGGSTSAPARRFDPTGLGTILRGGGSLPSIVRGGLERFAARFPMPGVVGGASTTALGGRRRRRMNPLNLRALRRADRRVTGFVRIARRHVAMRPRLKARRRRRR